MRPQNKYLPRGEKHPKARMTAEDVRLMRAEYLLLDISISELARQWGMSYTATWHIIRRRTWKHV